MSTHAYLLILSVFLISIVEAIEMMTIVYGVGEKRSWTPTLIGGGAGLLILAAAVAVLGTLLGDLPLDALRAVIGILLLLFGIQWLRKSIFKVSRAGIWSGEEEEEEAEGGPERRFAGLDWTAVLRGFQGVFLEGLEIAFVVITFGSAAEHLGLGAAAAAVALLLVVSITILSRGLLAEIPSNTLTLLVGILLTTYGTYWSTVGMGARFPGGDYGVIGVLAIIIGFSAAAVYVVRSQVNVRKQEGH